MRACSLLLAALLALLTAAATPAGQEPEPLERGARDYRVHCSSCHGEDGSGDGPLAEILTVPPGDLRLLARRERGVFPLQRVYRAIEGREEIRGHGLREMPVWGLSFSERGRDAPQADEVRERILQLARYLRSIQLTEDENRERR